MKLRAQKIDSNFSYTQLNLNKDDNNSEEQLSYMNYKKTVRKLHDTGQKTVITLLLMFLCLVMDVVCLNVLSFFKDLDMYQVLPRTYLRSFYGFPGDKLI